MAIRQTQKQYNKITVSPRRVVPVMRTESEPVEFVQELPDGRVVS